jgi:hypothetical protein
MAHDVIFVLCLSGTIILMGTSLRDLRRDSGLTLKEVLERMREAVSDVPRSHTGLIHIEQRGTDRLPVMKALAYAYGKSLEDIEAACRSECSE